MDKVSISSRQSLPLWERQGGSKGHKSAVDGALKAHRERAQQREARVAERLQMITSMNKQFFAEDRKIQNQAPQAQTNPQIIGNSVVTNPISIPLQQEMVQPGIEFRSMEDIYSDSPLMPGQEASMSIVAKELSAPEEVPVDEIPKGSYVDYQA